MSFSLSKLLQTAELPVLEKVESVRNLLARSKTDLRDDSVLTWSYATGQTGDMPLHMVVFEILLTRYLYTYTDYVEIAENMVHLLQQQGMQVTTPVLRDWLLPLAKIQALKDRGIPTIWPWLV
jgi:hypothetical protein